MEHLEQPSVAILLSTYNGAKYIESQLSSLKENATAFTLHWLDDHSTDDTRAILRSASRAFGIELCEWQTSLHLGLPRTFFHLLYCVEADIYLFCDQDDIWQPGKIDETVAYLRRDVTSPVLCFSDSLLFYGDDTTTLRPLSAALGSGRLLRAMPSTLRIFSPVPAAGHTQGFTRPLRDMFLRHKAIGERYAYMHDWWMHHIAMISGATNLLTNVPTALWRQHEASFCSKASSRRSWRLSDRIQSIQDWRRIVSRHCNGLVLAGPTLPASPNRNRLLNDAKLLAIADRRISATRLVQLMFRSGRAFWPRHVYESLLFAGVCRFSSASLSPSDLS